MKRAFEVKEKAFFIIFKGLSVAKNCLRAERTHECVFKEHMSVYTRWYYKCY